MDCVMAEYPLTLKQERFCLVYMETGNASEAYRQAYDCENMEDKTIWEAASRQLDNYKVIARVNELKAELQADLNITVESLTKKLETARKCAVKQGNPAGQVAATMGQAKLHGLLIDKLQDLTPAKLDTLTDQQVEELLEAHKASKGIPAESKH